MLQNSPHVLSMIIAWLWGLKFSTLFHMSIHKMVWLKRWLRGSNSLQDLCWRIATCQPLVGVTLFYTLLTWYNWGQLHITVLPLWNWYVEILQAFPICVSSDVLHTSRSHHHSGHLWAHTGSWGSMWGTNRRRLSSTWNPWLGICSQPVTLIAYLMRNIFRH